MVDRRHDRPEGSTVTLQLVGNQSERYPALTLQEFAKEALRSTTVAPRLDEDVDHVAVLIHGTPQILPLPVDRDEDFVQEPRIPETTLPSFQLPCVFRTELQTPLSDGFVGNDDPALGEQISHIPEAQAEPIIGPDSVADDFRRISVSAVARSVVVHPAIVPGAALT